MAVRILAVSINDKNELSVEQNGNANVFCRSDEPYDIHFTLTGQRLSGAEFCSSSQDPPAFSWVDTPPDLVFPILKMQTKRMLKLLDVNAGTASVGAWRYQLSVRRGSTLYQTTFDDSPVDIPPDDCGDQSATNNLVSIYMVNNPIIINR
jgi:hypothetical protein